MAASGVPPASFPLDYEARGYAYLERANATLLALLERQFSGASSLRLRVLDVGCGAGANARAFRERRHAVHWTGLEPEHTAAELARQTCDEVVESTLEAWLGNSGVGTSNGAAPDGEKPFDAVILSDVLEHLVEPVRLLRSLASDARCHDALFLISVPNYAVWYNRARTLLGRFEYAWSGLYDRTHLRFFTRSSITELIEYCGFDVVEQTASPSLVQSAAPLLRRWFERDVDRGEHLRLGENSAFRAYSRYVEPLESQLCRAWPELLAFQIVSAARVRV